MDGIAPAAPAAPVAPSPVDPGAPDAQIQADPSPAPQDSAEGSPQDDGGEGRQQPDGVHQRINELTFHRRRAERVAAEAIQENQALRAYLAGMQGQPGAQPPQPQGQPGQGQQPQSEAPPRAEDYADWPSFMQAQAQWTYRQMRAAETANAQEFQARQQQALAEAQQQHATRVREATLAGVVENASKKYADFEQTLTNPQLPSLRSVHPTVLDAAVYSEHAGDILYYLGKNPPEAVRIASLHPVQAIRELGRLEAKLASGQVQSSAAPAPVTTVGARSSGSDPLSDRASIADWMNARNRQVHKRKA